MFYDFVFFRSDVNPSCVFPSWCFTAANAQPVRAAWLVLPAIVGSVGVAQLATSCISILLRQPYTKTFPSLSFSHVNNQPPFFLSPPSHFYSDTPGETFVIWLGVLLCTCRDFSVLGEEEKNKRGIASLFALDCQCE